MKLNRTSRRLGVAGILLGIACMPLWAGKPASSPASQAGKFTIGRDTTYVTGPLNPDGTINYVQAWNDLFGKGVTNENNAAVLILQATGPSAAMEPWREKVLKALGLAGLPEKGDYLQHFPYSSETPVVLRDDERLGRAMTQPADPEKDSKIFAWLEANEKPLELFVAASKRSRFFILRMSRIDPPNLMDGLVSMSLASVRTASKALVAHALIRANQGDFEGAQSDLAAVHRLARLLAQSPGLIDYLVAIACDTLASRAEQGLSFRVELTPQQARRLLSTAAIPSLPLPIDQFGRGERLFNLDLVMILMRKGLEGYLDQAEKDRAGIFGSSPASEEKIALPKFELDFETYLRLVNQDFDRTVEAAHLKTFAQRYSALQKQAEDVLPEVKEIQVQTTTVTFSVNDARKRYKLLIEKVGVVDKKKLTKAIYQFDPWGFQESAMRARVFAMAEVVRANQRLAVVSLAIAEYRAEVGSLPQSLDQLAPKYLAKVPVDPFTDAPLKYRATDKGFLLYSVGPNMKDDNGKGKGTASGLADAQGNDDIAVLAK